MSVRFLDTSQKKKKIENHEWLTMWCLRLRQ